MVEGEGEKTSLDPDVRHGLLYCFLFSLVLFLFSLVIDSSHLPSFGHQIWTAFLSSVCSAVVSSLSLNRIFPNDHISLHSSDINREREIYFCIQEVQLCGM